MQLADAIDPHGATCLFCDEFFQIRLELQRLSETTSKLRLASVELTGIPEISALTDQLLEHLARAVLLLWPDWYDREFVLDRPTVFFENTHLIGRQHPEVNRGWLSAAANACHKGRFPVLPQFSATVQVRQMRLALAKQRLLIALFVADDNPPAERLLGLSRAAEWLSREAEAQVVVVLPTALARRPELDTINSSAVTWSTDRCDSRWDSTLGSDGETPAETPQQHIGAEYRGAERKHLVCPIIGRPHPESPGEQRLAGQLAVDDELRDLFQFNQPLATVLGNRFLVDLLWPEGRIVVEIDGYLHHSSRSMFNSDRERDYELTISNYLVLRLPHDFVVQDPALACERIREFVHFRLRHPISHEITA